MNSNPDSPVSEASSMDFTQDDIEASFMESQQQSSSISIPSLISAAGSAAKRRFPSGSSNTRDSKTRRREEPKRALSSQAGWDNATGNAKESPANLMKRDRDEMLDNHIVEHLRKEIGDPFLEPKSNATPSKDTTRAVS